MAHHWTYECGHTCEISAELAEAIADDPSLMVGDICRACEAEMEDIQIRQAEGDFSN